MEIHQLLVSASAGDAITNAAFEVRAVLRKVCPSDIYARYFDARLSDEVLPMKSYDHRRSADPAGDLLIFHASIGEPGVASFLRDRPERLVLMYHNISPAEAFRPYDPAFAGLLDAGRRDLAELRDRVFMALADSAYNARELEDLGYRDVRVTPLVIDPEALRSVEPDAQASNHLATNIEGPVILFVGQTLPHKRPDLLLQAYHLLVTYLVPDANLTLVGAPRLPSYHTALQTYVKELNLSRAWLTGQVTRGQLASFYRRADLFATASEHEGFCVPPVEAMSFGIPVVARSYGAVPETVGDGGLLLPAGSSAALLAEAMAAIITDGGLRADLIDRGRRRLVAFDPDAARATLLSHLMDAA